MKVLLADLEIDTDMLLSAMRDRRQIIEAMREKVKNAEIERMRDVCILCREYVSGSSFGALIEAWLRAKFGLQKSDEGDIYVHIEDQKELWEVKVSLGDKDDSWIMQQLRPHHRAVKYLIVLYNVVDDEVTYCLVPYDKMNEAILEWGGYSHGTIKEKGIITAETLYKSDNEFGIPFSKFAKKGTKKKAAWEYLSQYQIEEEELFRILGNE